MLSLWIAGALAVATNEIVRFDRVFQEPNEHHGIFTHQMKAATFAAKPPQRFLRKALAPGEAFKIDFICDSTLSRSVCDNARQGLQNAVSRIAQVLQVSQQITMEARFYPFCPANNKNCERSGGLGSAQYGSAFPIEKDGHFYTMCQGLLKQLRADSQVEFGPYDIRAEFNADANWFFRNGTGGSLGPEDFDFEFTSAHEIVHGLGYGSGLLLFSDIYPGAGPNYLAPNLFGAQNGASSSDIFRYMEPVDIFDSFVSNGNVQFKDLAARIAKFPIQEQNFRRFISNFEASGDPFQAAQEAYRLATRGDTSLVFTPPGGQPIPLYQPRDYQQGSSLSHVTLEAGETADFLMIPALAPGKDVDVTIRQTSAGSIFGPGTTAIMEAVGWPTRNKPDPQPVKLALNYGKGAVGSIPTATGSTGGNRNSALRDSGITLAVIGLVFNFF
jgi:hypothetical protein